MRPWTAPGAAGRVAVSADGEVLACLSDPYAALDARRLPREHHLPRRNLVSTLFELNGLGEGDDAEAPLRRLGTWLHLGELAGRVQAAYAEWLATVNETLYPGATAKALVERLTGADHEEDPMAVTVLEEQLQRRIRRERRDAEAVGVQRGIELGKQLCIELGMQRCIELGTQRCIELGMQRWYIEQDLADTRSLLAGLVTRKFGAGTAARTADLLAGIGDADGLRRASEWAIDSTTAEELVQRLENGKP